MKLPPFALERYFSQFEFKTKYTLSSSDCESLSVQELLMLADHDTSALWKDLKLGYTESPGHPILREAVSALYTSVEPDCVLIAAPEELIFLAMHALLEQGDEIIVTTPAYQSLHEIARSLGCRVHQWELAPTNNGWDLDLQYFLDHVNNCTKLVIVNFPHNPTGHHITVEVQREIIEIARKYGVQVFSDEMYRGAEYTPEEQLPAVVDIYENGISLWGLSKSFGLPGLRIGWLASKNKSFLSHCQGIKDYLTICNSAPGEILGIVALRSKDRILQRTRDIISENLHSADDFFAGHTDAFAWLRPKAGSVAFPELKMRMRVGDFCRRLIEENDLLVTPGSLFQHSGNHFRIGIGRKSFREALDILASTLE